MDLNVSMTEKETYKGLFISHFVGFWPCLYYMYLEDFDLNLKHTTRASNQ